MGRYVDDDAGALGGSLDSAGVVGAADAELVEIELDKPVEDALDQPGDNTQDGSDSSAGSVLGDERVVEDVSVRTDWIAFGPQKYIFDSR